MAQADTLNMQLLAYEELDIVWLGLQWVMEGAGGWGSLCVSNRQGLLCCL